MLFLWSQKQVFMLHAIDKLKFKLSKEVKKGDFMNETVAFYVNSNGKIE